VSVTDQVAIAGVGTTPFRGTCLVARWSRAHNGQHVAVATLKKKTGLWIDDADLLYAYDGYTVITVNWLENLGFCEQARPVPSCVMRGIR
jgi:hypothetical protein